MIDGSLVALITVVVFVAGMALGAGLVLRIPEEK